MIIRKKAYARAALIGNPSDGYFGKTIAFTFKNFAAEIVLYESPELEILPNSRDRSVFTSIDQLAGDVRLYGYYGGIRLLKATVKRFFDYSQERGIELHDGNFTIRYSSTIPHLVGLAGSSAIITACMQALLAFYGVTIPNPDLANLILAVEKEELDISAGLQDRVAQVYQGLIHMDFDEQVMKTQGFGHYTPLDAARLPPLYIAYRTDLSEGSEIFHNHIRARFERGEKDIMDAMLFWADLTEQARTALDQGHPEALEDLLNQNFDRRAQLYRISEGNLRMVETARDLGASAKFTGSGGAIVGTYKDEEMLQELTTRLESINVRVLRPEIV